jgi:MOSC domain-containing protein YiiM
VSVNVGGVREVVWRGRSVRTGIWKSSVGDRAVQIEGVNLVGDDQADRHAHGGPNKAVYAYALEDHTYWHDAEGIPVEHGRFGENLTTEGMDLRTAVIGARWRVGTALLEVAQPRHPCFKLGIRMADADFPQRFLAAGRLGAYLRIIQPGVVRAGDEIRVERQPRHGVTLHDAWRALGDDALARALLDVPELAPGWRQTILARLAAREADGTSRIDA